MMTEKQLARKIEKARREIEAHNHVPDEMKTRAYKGLDKLPALYKQSKGEFFQGRNVNFFYWNIRTGESRHFWSRLNDLLEFPKDGIPLNDEYGAHKFTTRGFTMYGTYKPKVSWKWYDSLMKLRSVKGPIREGESNLKLEGYWVHRKEGIPGDYIKIGCQVFRWSSWEKLAEFRKTRKERTSNGKDTSN